MSRHFNQLLANKKKRIEARGSGLLPWIIRILGATSWLEADHRPTHYTRTIHSYTLSQALTIPTRPSKCDYRLQRGAHVITAPAPVPVWCDYTFNTSTCVITESPQCTQYLGKYRLFCSWMITRGWNGWLQRGWKFWLQRGGRLSGVYDLITKEVWSQIIAHSQGQYGFRFQCYDDMKTWWYDWYTIWWSGIIAYKAMMIWKPHDLI